MNWYFQLPSCPGGARVHCRQAWAMQEVPTPTSCSGHALSPLGVFLLWHRSLEPGCPSAWSPGRFCSPTLSFTFCCA